MRNSNIARKVKESIKRQRQRKIIELKEIRKTKKRVGEVITNEDYHPSGHIRHGK